MKKAPEETPLDDDELDQQGGLPSASIDADQTPVPEPPNKIRTFNLSGSGMFSRRFTLSISGPAFGANTGGPGTPFTQPPSLKRTFRSSPTPPPVLGFEEKDPFETEKRLPTLSPTSIAKSTTTTTTSKVAPVAASSIVASGQKKLKEEQEQAQENAAESQPQSPEPDPLKQESNPTGAKPQQNLLWIKNYLAKRFTNLIGDERTHRQVLPWLKSWNSVVFPFAGRQAKKKVETEDQPERRKILLIHGPLGVGKTTSAHVAAKQAGYEVAEVNASDERSAALVKGRIKDILSNEGVKIMDLTSGKKTIGGRLVCLVVDEIDGVTEGGCGGGAGEGVFVKAFIDLVFTDQKNQVTFSINKRRRRKGDDFRLMRPTVVICNDLYAPALKALRPLAGIVYMRKPPLGLMVGSLKWVFEKAGFTVKESAWRHERSISGRRVDRRPTPQPEALFNRLQKAFKTLLIRAMVEVEFGGGKKHPTAKDKTSGNEIREAVERVGKFDKITVDCFSTYPTRSFHDDAFLTKPCGACEWLWFVDLLSSKVFHYQEYELMGYLSHPIVAFHNLFASAAHKDTPMGRYNAGESSQDAADKEPTPSSGPAAEWEFKEGVKGNRTVIQILHSSLACMAMELAAWICQILTPKLSAVVVGGSVQAGGIASVRRDGEKRLVKRGVEFMLGCGLAFKKVCFEGIFCGGNAEWVFKMESPIDSLSRFPTLTASIDQPQPLPVRYPIRQCLDQEYQKELILRRPSARQARIGEPNATFSLPAASASSKKCAVKRDFFGRIIEDMPEGDEGVKVETTTRKKRKFSAENQNERVWVSFNEGYSNAVSKGLTLKKLMRYFI
ncbi:Chromosome transmission fidelity protein 18 [Rhizina undulata]